MTTTSVVHCVSSWDSYVQVCVTQYFVIQAIICALHAFVHSLVGFVWVCAVIVSACLAFMQYQGCLLGLVTQDGRECCQLAFVWLTQLICCL